MQQDLRALWIAQDQQAKTMLTFLTQLQSQLYNIGSNTGSPRREPTSPAGAHSSPAHSPMRAADRTLHGSTVDVGGNRGLTTSATATSSASATVTVRAAAGGGSASDASNDIAAAGAVRPIDVASANSDTATLNTVVLLPMQSMSAPTAAAPRPAVVLNRTAASASTPPNGAADASKLAIHVFIEAYSKNNGHSPVVGTYQDQQRVAMCLMFFKGLLNASEKAFLLARPEPGGTERANWDATVKRMANTLHKLILKFFIKAHRTQSLELKTLTVSKNLKVSTIEGLCRKLKWDMTALKKVTEPDALTKFRNEVEAEEATRKRLLPTVADTTAPKKARKPVHVQHAQQQQTQGANASMPSSHGALTSFGDCSHDTDRCKATNTPCSQCPRLVCSECALVISGGDVAKGYVCPAHLQDRTCAYRLGTCMATLHKCKEPGCGLLVCSICAARISSEYPPDGYWCQTHANKLKAASNII